MLFRLQIYKNISVLLSICQKSLEWSIKFVCYVRACVRTIARDKGTTRATLYANALVYRYLSVATMHKKELPWRYSAATARLEKKYARRLEKYARRLKKYARRLEK